MNIKNNIDKNDLDIAIQKITPKIIEKIKEYKETKDKIVQKELAQLLSDRDSIYQNKQDIIKKYLEG